ncbi:hypothetical protein Goari_025381 [Gossypium aridum]|uniref:Uncharacterized protein n=1 Tax=Gossypium aridum TaxID=34290 RepID=A0A7J8X9I1_GOSAI|nr:hypothetical protein [Gossypium aridum]
MVWSKWIEVLLQLEEYREIKVKGGSLVLTCIWDFVLLLRLSYGASKMV